MEIFKDIKGYEGLYQVSNLGNVKSLNYGRTGKERILKAADDGRGYLSVGLSKNGKSNSHKVHKLVAIAFLGHKPCGMNLVVNHIDFNKLNNNVENLEIVTQRKNANKKHLKSASKYIGVSWNKRNKKWQSKITIKDNQKHLGYFENEEDASDAYKQELNKIK